MIKHILLSIKTRFVEEIIAGTKLYEYRKSIPDFSDEQISKTIIIYSSKDEKAIIGEFEIDTIISTNIDNLIAQTNIRLEQELFFREYFKEKYICHAIKIKNFKKYNTPLSLQKLRTIDPNFVAPQNYRFLWSNNILYTHIRRNSKAISV